MSQAQTQPVDPREIGRLLKSDKITLPQALNLYRSLSEAEKEEYRALQRQEQMDSLAAQLPTLIRIAAIGLSEEKDVDAIHAAVVFTVREVGNYVNTYGTGEQKVNATLELLAGVAARGLLEGKSGRMQEVEQVIKDAADRYNAAHPEESVLEL